MVRSRRYQKKKGISMLTNKHLLIIQVILLVAILLEGTVIGVQWSLGTIDTNQLMGDFSYILLLLGMFYMIHNTSSQSPKKESQSQKTERLDAIKKSISNAEASTEVSKDFDTYMEERLLAEKRKYPDEVTEKKEGQPEKIRGIWNIKDHLNTSSFVHYTAYDVDSSPIGLFNVVLSKTEDDKWFASNFSTFSFVSQYLFSPKSEVYSAPYLFDSFEEADEYIFEVAQHALGKNAEEVKAIIGIERS